MFVTNPASEKNCFKKIEKGMSALNLAIQNIFYENSSCFIVSINLVTVALQKYKNLIKQKQKMNKA